MPRSPGPAPTLRTAAWLRVPCLLVALLSACSTSTGPRPQSATFPPGERIARSGVVSVELAKAHYDLRRVSVTVSLTNHGKTPVRLDREGILLAYHDLEFPVQQSDAAPVEASTTVPPGATVQLELGFGTEQLMVEAGRLQLLSLRAGEAWLAPLQLTVPPPAAFVEAAAEPEDPEDEDE